VLPIKKIQNGYYQLDGNIVNLKLDEEQPRIMSKKRLKLSKYSSDLNKWG
jgi:hypothetical protein